MKVSKETQQWIRSINTKSGYDPSLQVIEELKQFCPDHPVTIYRGIYFHDFEDFCSKTNLTEFPDKAGKRLVAKVGIHWTLDQSIAAEFANGPGPYGLLLEAVVDPEDIVLEVDKLPFKLKQGLEWLEESEVILKSSPSNCIVIGFKLPKLK